MQSVCPTTRYSDHRALATRKSKRLCFCAQHAHEIIFSCFSHYEHIPLFISQFVVLQAKHIQLMNSQTDYCSYIHILFKNFFHQHLLRYCFLKCESSQNQLFFSNYFSWWLDIVLTIAYIKNLRILSFISQMDYNPMYLIF